MPVVVKTPALPVVVSLVVVIVETMSIMRACHPGRASGNNLNPALSTRQVTTATPPPTYFNCNG